MCVCEGCARDACAVPSLATTPHPPKKIPNQKQPKKQQNNQKAPNFADAYYTLGALHEAEGDARKALDFLMIAAHMSPKVFLGGGAFVCCCAVCCVLRAIRLKQPAAHPALCSTSTAP